MMIDKVKSYISENGISKMIENSSKVLVGFSGGADSSVLLYMLVKLFGSERIAACHLNHMIRGAEAERDMEFAKKAAEALKIEFFSEYADIPKIAAEKNMGLEQAARDERYRLFLETSKKLGDSILIATAHNMTDNLETVVFNLARGTGISGIAGIAPVRDNIIRPLLCLTSEEIRSFAKANNIEYVVDSTNRDDSYTRNHIRNNIVPLLREINPSVDIAALRLSSSARCDADYISKEAEGLISEDGTIDRGAYLFAHMAVKLRAIAMLYSKAAGGSDGLSSVNLNSAVKLADDGFGKICFKGVDFVVDRDKLYFEKRQTKKRIESKELLVKIGGGFVKINDDFAVGIAEKGKELTFDENIYNLFIKHSFSFDRIYGSIFVRERRAGDTVLVGAHHKMLKKMMNEKKIPLRYRESLPVFCDGKGIFCVPSVCLRDGAQGDGLILYVLLRRGI